MQPEQMFERLLNLGDEWKVTRVKLEGEGIGKEVVIEVEETPALWKRLRCPDGGEVFCYDHTEELSWGHLNVFEYRCEIRCRLPRAKSRKTDADFRVPVPWEGLSKHFTFGFEAAALMLMREMPVRKVGEVLGETDTRLWRMLREQVVGVDFDNAAMVHLPGQESLLVFNLIRRPFKRAQRGFI